MSELTPARSRRRRGDLRRHHLRPRRRRAAASSPRRAARPSLGQAGPYAMTGLGWLADPLAAPPRRATPSRSTSPAPPPCGSTWPAWGSSTVAPLTGTVTTEHPLELRLAGTWATRPVVRIDGQVAPVARPAPRRAHHHRPGRRPPAGHRVTHRAVPRCTADRAARPARRGRIVRGGTRRRRGARRHGAPLGQVYARIGATEIVLGNDLVERRWSRIRLRHDRASSTAAPARRTPAGPHRDFALRVGGATVGSERLTATGVSVDAPRQAACACGSPSTGLPGVQVTRIVEAYEGIAGIRSQTHPPPARAVAAQRLHARRGGGRAPSRRRIHALRAGADWREPEWTGPQLDGR